MIRKLSGTTAVITGATSGSGRETALEFARAGVSVAVAGRREERLRQAINLFNRLASGLMDLALSWSVPFTEGMRRGEASTTANSGNLYQPRDKE